MTRNPLHRFSLYDARRRERVENCVKNLEMFKFLRRNSEDITDYKRITKSYSGKNRTNQIPVLSFFLNTLSRHGIRLIAAARSSPFCTIVVNILHHDTRTSNIYVVVDGVYPLGQPISWSFFYRVVVMFIELLSAFLVIRPHRSCRASRNFSCISYFFVFDMIEEYVCPWITE